MNKRKSIAVPLGGSVGSNNPEMSKTDFEALAKFRYQLRLFLRFSEELCNTSSITPLQYQLLLQIKGYPGRAWASVTELAERLQAKHHGVVALVSRCESLGLVQRRSSTTDLRQVEVHLTDEGARTVERLARQHRDELETFFMYCGQAGGLTLAGVQTNNP